MDRAERPAPPRKAGGKGKKGRGASPSPFARFMKLMMIIAFMGALGFGAVLIADVGLTLLGGMKFGDITFAELVDKVQARVFDHDVPEARKKAPATGAHKATKKPRPSSSSSSGSNVAAPVVRAPMAAPSPDAYAKEAVARPDPEVEQARARLDQLLKGI